MLETEKGIILTLMRHGGDEVEIAWSAIESIIAYKQDLFNPQIVVLEIRTASLSWEVDAKDCSGFVIFSRILVKYLPGFPSHATWWSMVTDPLGRQEEHCLFRR